MVQAFGIAGWWVLLVLMPDARGLFFPEALAGDPLMSFWLADLVLLCGGSALVAWLTATNRPAAGAGAWFLGGAFYYPAVYCLVVSHRYGEGELGVAAMFAGGGMTLAMATVIGQRDTSAGFRPCDGSLAWAAIKTALQIAVFWTTFLYVLPLAVVSLQERAGIGAFEFAGRWWVGFVVFLGFGLLGLSSAVWTLCIGRGTPLPTDCASRLVVVGPYRWVRNPMALAGIMQGVGVGLMWGSWLVVGYAVLGGVVWHVLVRPVEEADLLRRFGASYEAYRGGVRCWWPGRWRGA
ncbi:MAG: methyltransferase family protein [Phycisphaeraceae bacterium]